MESRSFFFSWLTCFSRVWAPSRMGSHLSIVSSDRMGPRFRSHKKRPWMEGGPTSPGLGDETDWHVFFSRIQVLGWSSKYQVMKSCDPTLEVWFITPSISGHINKIIHHPKKITSWIARWIWLFTCILGVVYIWLGFDCGKYRWIL